jgi:NAD(P)-dependent dehydrogenase (short-subunit alcohol dehydrogenase family)
MGETASKSWAVVLGASAGTGAAIVRAVAKDPGLDVFGVHRGRHPDSAAAVERDVTALGRRVHMSVGSASTHDDSVRGADELLRVAGPKSVRLFVHSIANASVGSLVSGDDRQLRRFQLEKTFDSMAHSFVYWVQEMLARDLLAPGAQILGLTNPVVDSLVPELGLIAATKAALEVYVRQLAIELGPRGYRVNLLNFGLVDTPAGRAGFTPEAWAAVVRRGGAATPAGRLCTVEEVARFVSVLAGDAAAWFNGATIDFTGGMIQGLLGAVLLGKGG